MGRGGKNKKVHTQKTEILSNIVTVTHKQRLLKVAHLNKMSPYSIYLIPFDNELIIIIIMVYSMKSIKWLFHH